MYLFFSQDGLVVGTNRLRSFVVLSILLRRIHGWGAFLFFFFDRGSGGIVYVIVYESSRHTTCPTAALRNNQQQVFPSPTDSIGCLVIIQIFLFFARFLLTVCLAFLSTHDNIISTVPISYTTTTLFAGNHALAWSPQKTETL